MVKDPFKEWDGVTTFSALLVHLGWYSRAIFFMGLCIFIPGEVGKDSIHWLLLLTLGKVMLIHIDTLWKKLQHCDISALKDSLVFSQLGHYIFNHTPPPNPRKVLWFKKINGITNWQICPKKTCFSATFYSVSPPTSTQNNFRRTKMFPLVIQKLLTV